MANKDQVIMCAGHVSVWVTKDPEYILFNDGLFPNGEAVFNREEALAAAKAILIHYGISYQVGEEAW